MNTRRTFLKTSATLAAFPAIVPSSVFGQNAPSNRINVGAIGVGLEFVLRAEQGRRDDDRVEARQVALGGIEGREKALRV